jgi:hypothetical protein
MNQMMNVFYDLVASTRLFEYIQSRRSAAISIQNLSSPIVGHLIKILVFGNHSDYIVWIRELDTWLDQIDRIYLEPDHVKPSASDISFWLFQGAVLDYDSEYVTRKVNFWLKGRYQSIPEPSYDASLVLEQIQTMLDRISADLSMPHKFISVKKYLVIA